jgi:hypothetical protein
MGTYKIVNTFNGHEDDRRFASLEDAEAVIDEELSDFLIANPGMSPWSYRAAVVDADSEWYHNGRDWGWS